MRDQKQRAVVILKQLFQQFQRLDIQIIGRLIQHQNIGWFGEQTRQQQAIALATRQGFDRRMRALWREQKVAQIADDVFAHAIDLDPIRAGANGVGQGFFQIQLRTHLVKIGNL